MTQHNTLCMARITQHLLRYKSRLSHRLVMKVLSAAFHAGEAAERAKRLKVSTGAAVPANDFLA